MENPSNQCLADPTKSTSFSAEIQCSLSYAEQGEAKIIYVDYFNDPCNLHVVMTHRAGCPKNAFSYFFRSFPEFDSAVFTSLMSLILFIFLLFAVPWLEANLPSPF